MLEDEGKDWVEITVKGCTSGSDCTEIVVNPLPSMTYITDNGKGWEGAEIYSSTVLVSVATYAWTGPNGFMASTLLVNSLFFQKRKYGTY